MRVPTLNIRVSAVGNRGAYGIKSFKRTVGEKGYDLSISNRRLEYEIKREPVRAFSGFDSIYRSENGKRRKKEKKANHRRGYEMIKRWNFVVVYLFIVLPCKYFFFWQVFYNPLHPLFKGGFGCGFVALCDRFSNETVNLIC